MDENINTEDLIIIRYTEELLANTSLTRAKFIQDRLLPSLQHAGFFEDEQETAASYERWFDSKRKLIGGIFNRTRYMPMRWKWVWIGCLPTEYQVACKKELWALHGSLYIPFPASSEQRMPTASGISDLMREFSDVLDAATPAHDGMYDATDDPDKLRHLSEQIWELVERGIAELRAIETATGIISGRQMTALLQALQHQQP